MKVKYIIWTILNFCLLSTYAQHDTKGTIPTVNGKLDVNDLNFALTHEHLMSNFGKDPGEASQYDEEALFKQVIPYLKKIKTLGVNSIFDCTTAYFGRRVDLLKVMSDSSGLIIITNTGFYGAANDRYVPAMAYKASAKEIADLWIDEYKNGIEGTNIKPGFIKLAFDTGVPSDIDKKLFTAGILTHRQTGLIMAVHTGNNPQAITTQLNLLSQFKVHPSAVVLVHANNIQDTALLIKVAAQGVWISLDGVKATNVSEYINKLKLFRSRNLLHKVLLSHDGDAYTMDGSMREFSAIMENLIPAIKKNGFTDKEINLLMIENPKNAFTPKT